MAPLLTKLKKGPGSVVSTLALLLVSLIISVGAAEALIRLALGRKDRWAPAPAYVGEFANRSSPTFLADSLVGWRMRPDRAFRWIIDGHENEYSANPDGFRSPYSRSDVLAATRRVILVGDSFAWGTGVDYEETFGALLDDMLDEAIVYNEAQPGAGLDQMWMTVRHAALPLEPDVVIVAFIDQDLDRSLTAFRAGEGMNKPTFVVSGDGLRPQSPADRPAAPIRWLQRHSAIWGLGHLAMRTVGYSFPVGSWLSTNAAIIDGIARETAQAGTQLVIVRLPTKDGRPFPQMAALLDTTDASYLDLGESPPADLFFRTDDHINAEGHRYVAEALGPLLAQMLR